MADLNINFAGIKSPNPFWLALAPPTNMGSMIERAFGRIGRRGLEGARRTNRSSSPASIMIEICY